MNQTRGFLLDLVWFMLYKMPPSIYGASLTAAGQQKMREQKIRFSERDKNV